MRRVRNQVHFRGTIVVFSILFLSALIVSSASLAQSGGTAKNTVFFEGFGNGLLYSLNYDRLLSERVSLRVGFSYMEFDDFFFSDVSFTVFPILINGLFGSGNHKFELGGGIDIVVADTESSVNDTEIISGVLLAAAVGYRYQRPEGGVFFRMGFTPIIALNENGGIIPWPGASIGVSF